MLKSVVLSLLLWHEMCQFSSHADRDIKTRTRIFSVNVSPTINKTDMKLEPVGNNNFIGKKQIFHVNGPLLGISRFVRHLNSIDNVPKADNLVTNEIGVFKVHRRPVTWGKARELCLQEGGHLATMKSQEEEKIVVNMMGEHSVDEAWIGYHDQFVEGNWVSVFDEPLDESGWDRWSTIFRVNPDNTGGKQNCGVLMRKRGGGMDDQNCDVAKSFVCKISTF